MSTLEWILIIVPTVLIFSVIGIAHLIAKNVFNPPIRSLEESRKNEDQESPGLMKSYDSWNIEKRRLKTRNNTEIQVYDVAPDKPTKDFVIIAHGYTYTHHGAIKYARMFKKLGFHVILFDERFHGASEGKNSTQGGYEKIDLQDLVTDTFDRYGHDLFLGTFGESMGAATAIMEASIDDRVQFVGADCSFADFRMQVAYLIKRKLKLPRWPFVPLASLFFKLNTGLWFKEISPINSLETVHVPIFFAHGLADKYIPPVQTRLLYEKCSTEKTIFWGENDSRHAGTARKNEAAYFTALKGFIETVKGKRQNEVEE